MPGTSSTHTVNDAKLRERLRKVPDLRILKNWDGKELILYWYEGTPQPQNANLVAKLSVALDENGLPFTLVSYEREGFMLLR